MMRFWQLVLGTLGVGALLATPQMAAAIDVELFRDQMNAASDPAWGMNADAADDTLATFGYDYSADDIPEAPNFRAGDTATSGVKLEANLGVSVGADKFTLYPIGESYTGDYRLRFDAWMNYDVDERINGGSDGTTEFIGGGIGYDDTAADIGPGAQIVATGDGGSSNDWRAFADGAFLVDAEMAYGTHNGFIHAGFLPGVSPPAGQNQLDFPAGTAGSPGFQWVTFDITTANDLATVIIEKPSGERRAIVSFNQTDRPFTSDGNISLIYADFFGGSVTVRPDLTFGLIDNVVVTQIPEPASVLLLMGGGLALLVVRRRLR